ncbi:MAG: hypothetical protein GW855_09355 [Erythrobacter sp.]|nr:hypothetical protein [Erythrobacter sp.]NCQ65124.1 hypothetical protein [Alphaproteobacteria bacterium]
MPDKPPGAPKPRARRETLSIAASQARGGEEATNPRWRTHFLQALAATSNVTASARQARVSPSRAYKARRDSPEFAEAWRTALHEGYEHLEMEVLAQLRGHDPDRKLDIANAIRLLAAHRDTIAIERAKRQGQDEAAVFAALERKLATIRVRLAKNDAPLRTDGDDR